MKKSYPKFTILSVPVYLTIYLFCLIVPVFCQSSTVSGYVSDTQRQPVTQAPVELLNDLNSVLQRTKTDNAGRYMFRGISSGRFFVRVLPIGTNLEEKIQEFEISGIGARGRPLADNIQLDFQLRRLKENTGGGINGVLFVQEVPEEAKKMYENAISDLDNKKLDQGIEGLQNALKIFPTYYAALEKLGAEYITLQKFDLAKELFNKGVEVNSRSFNCWYGLSYANYHLKQSAAAIESAQKATSLNPNSIDAVFYLGLSQRLAKDYAESEKTLKQADKMAKGKSPDIHWNLALLYAHNLNRFQDAANHLELYLKYTPDASNSESIKKLIKQFREKAK